MLFFIVHALFDLLGRIMLRILFRINFYFLLFFVEKKLRFLYCGNIPRKIDYKLVSWRISLYVKKRFNPINSKKKKEEIHLWYIFSKHLFTLVKNVITSDNGRITVRRCKNTFYLLLLALTK